jgi:hypothetical protein
VPAAVISEPPKRRPSYYERRGGCKDCELGLANWDKSSLGHSHDRSDLKSRVARLIMRVPGPFRDPLHGRSLVINTPPAFAGFGPARRIGRRRKAVCPAVTHPSVHTLPALSPPALLSLVAQVHSLEIWCASLYDSTAILSMCSKQTVVAHRAVMTPLV